MMMMMVMGGALRVPFTGLNLCDVSPMLRHPRDTQMCNYFEIYAFFVSTKREIVDLCVFFMYKFWGKCHHHGR